MKKLKQQYHNEEKFKEESFKAIDSKIRFGDLDIINNLIKHNHVPPNSLELSPKKEDTREDSDIFNEHSN